MKCIYCLNDSSAAKGVAHIFPEAIFKNDVTLPIGSVCDECNNYLKELDSALIAHNHIWPLIQLIGLPGKKGKPRKKLGFMELSEDAQSLSMKFTQKNIGKISFTGKQVQIHVKNPQNFDDKLFRRALHHIAFNALTFMGGKELMMNNIFNNARKYIRQPKKGEIWPYIQQFPSERQNPVDAQPIPSTHGLIIRLGIFHDDFYVDLLNTGDLHSWAAAHFQNSALRH